MGSKNSLPHSDRGSWHLLTGHGPPRIDYGYYDNVHQGQHGSVKVFVPTRKPKGQNPPADLKFKLNEEQRKFSNYMKGISPLEQSQPQGAVPIRLDPINSQPSAPPATANQLLQQQQEILKLEERLKTCNRIRKDLENLKAQQGGSRKTRKNRKQKPHRARTASRKR